MIIILNILCIGLIVCALFIILYIRLVRCYLGVITAAVRAQITAAERLSVGLQYLATGNSQVNEQSCLLFL